MKGVINFKIYILYCLSISRSPLSTDVSSCNIQLRTIAVYPHVISLSCRATVPWLRRLVDASHRGGSGSILDQTIWDCSGYNGNGTGFSPNTPVLSVTTIPPTFHTHISFTYHPRYVMLATDSVLKYKKKLSLFCRALVSSGCLK
jgi:hypothetical protein